MKAFLSVLFFGCLVIESNGEERREAEYLAKTYLTAPLSDGSPPQPVVTPMAPSFRIDSSRVVELKGRKLFIHRVAPPVIPEKPEKAVEPEMTEDAVKTEVNDEVLESELILLSATVYANNLSFIRFWIGGEEYSAWTDIDFHLFSGVISFVHDRCSYGIVMGIGDGGGMPTDAVRPGKAGSFVFIGDDAVNPAALRVADAFSSLYHSQKDELIEAKLGRELAKRRAAARQPEKPADIVIYMWDKPSRPLTSAEKEIRDMKKEAVSWSE